MTVKSAGAIGVVDTQQRTTMFVDSRTRLPERCTMPAAVGSATKQCRASGGVSIQKISKSFYNMPLHLWRRRRRAAPTVVPLACSTVQTGASWCSVQEMARAERELSRPWWPLLASMFRDHARLQDTARRRDCLGQDWPTISVGVLRRTYNEPLSVEFRDFHGEIVPCI